MEPPYSDHADSGEEDEDLGSTPLDCYETGPDTCGDFGWSLDYATAYAYRNIREHREEVLRALDNVRLCRDICPTTAYSIFQQLDDVIFRSKLKLQKHVNLRWTDEEGSPPGATFVPHRRGVPKICIELSILPYQHDSTGIDSLLETLIHQMIHAWFLMCCGAQQDDEPEDGRLADALHFGILIYAINEIAKGCARGPLKLAFCTAKSDGHTQYISSPYVHASGRHGCGTYIVVDSNGRLVGAPPSAGSTRCSLDSHRIPLKSIKDYHLHDYFKAWEIDWEARGTHLRIFRPSYDADTDRTNYELDAICRIHAPPSRQYFEGIWRDLRFMLPKECVVRFPSLQGLIEADSTGRDIRFADCSMTVFALVYEFITTGHYWPMVDHLHGDDRPSCWRGAAVYTPKSDTPDYRQTTHVEVFTVAENLGFDELRDYAYRRLMSMTTTSEDPMNALELVYLGEKKPHGDLRYWARCFLNKIPPGYVVDPDIPFRLQENTNFRKILNSDKRRFITLMNQNRYFVADVADHFPGTWKQKQGIMTCYTHSPIQGTDPFHGW